LRGFHGDVRQRGEGEVFGEGGRVFAAAEVRDGQGSAIQLSILEGNVVAALSDAFAEAQIADGQYRNGRAILFSKLPRGWYLSSGRNTVAGGVFAAACARQDSFDPGATKNSVAIMRAFFKFTRAEKGNWCSEN